MPTLDWIGKQAVVNHHREVPYRLVHCDSDLSAGDPDAGNLLVQGDNLEALRALLPYYAGQVKCIYIDPPYNTGNEGWAYNDNVNSPEISAWLDEVVGKEGEDLSRHDKWLCMMYPRLRLLREFLREDGSIWISCDDNEVDHLRQLLSEIFGRKNIAATIIWQKKYSRQNDSSYFSTSHDYLICACKSIGNWAPNKVARTEAQKKGYSNPDNDERGLWQSVVYTCSKTRTERPNLYYPVKHPKTGQQIYPSESRVWGYEQATYKKHVEENRLWWGKNGEYEKPRLKSFLSKAGAGIVPDTLWMRSEVGDNQDAKREILSLFDGDGDAFPTPKPTKLMRRIVEIASSEGDLILDSFAGSGTLGHAILDMNASARSGRQFILVEMDQAISKDVTAERLKRVIEGYDKGGDPEKPVEGLGGGFRFCHLGVPLFDEFGDIATDVRFPDLAAHIFFSETGVPIPQKATSEYLGIFQDRAVYLLFDAAHAETPREAAGNVLTPDRLAALPPPPEGFEGLCVVYGEGCTVSAARLKAAGVVFKQIPYQIDGAG